jgi:hypothetical protein
MIRASVRLAVVAAFLCLGWVAGRAQTSQPTFELVVNAPAGETTIQCVRGCELSWVERGVSPNAQTMQTFTFKCTSPSGRCSSHKVGGWLKSSE